MPGVEGSRTVEVHLGRDADLDGWRTAHAAGDVPDALPYGLDRLESHGWAAVGGARSRLPRAVRGAVRRAGAGIDWLGPGPSSTAADCVLAWDERIGIPLATRRRPSTPVVTGVIWLTDRRPPAALRPALQRGLSAASRAFTLCSAQIPVLVQQWGLDPARLAVVPFGVDTDFFCPQSDDAGSDPDLVVTMGNDRDRDFGTLFDAFAHVRAARPATRLVVVSASPAVTAAHNIEGVTTIDRLDHRGVRSLLGRAAVSVTPTRVNLHASGVTAVLEALAMGTPVVASSTPGMTDYAGPGLHLVEPGAADKLGEALLDLLSSPPGATDRATTRQHVRDSFSTRTQAGHLSRLLDSAATQP